MSDVLARWNELSPEKAAEEILPCCGSKTWAQQMAARRPVHNEAAVLAASDEVWRNLPESGWLEAFRSHPRIGELSVPSASAARSANWSGEEQRRVTAAGGGGEGGLAGGETGLEEKGKRNIFFFCAR